MFLGKLLKWKCVGESEKKLQEALMFFKSVFEKKYESERCQEQGGSVWRGQVADCKITL